MAAPQEILDLVARFEEHRDAYHAGSYSESELRTEFIDPFFEALGWDITNKAGYAEQYKDVIHEDAIKVAGATKAPDYCFRIGGVRKFFLETKKPSVDIKEQTIPAYQLRRYAWSAKPPWSQTEGPCRNTLAAGVCFATIRMVPAKQHHLGKTELHARER